MKFCAIILSIGLGSGVAGFLLGELTKTSNSEQEKPSASRSYSLDDRSISPNPTAIYRELMKLTNQQGELAGSLAILEMSYNEILSLLENPEFNLDDPSYNEELFISCFARLAQINPQGGMALAEKYDQQQKLATSTLIKEWSVSDPDRLLEFAVKPENKKYKASIFSLGLRTLLKNDPIKAYDLAEKYDYQYKSEILGSMAKLDPLLALSKADSRSEKGNVMATWLRSDYEAAMAYYEGMEDEKAKSLLMSGASYHLSMKDQVTFLKAYSKSAPSDRNDISADLIFKQMAEDDPENAVNYLDTLTNPKLRRNALTSMLPGFVAKDPNLAIQLVESIKEPADQDAALGVLYKNLSSKDPALVASALKENDFNSFGKYNLEDFVSTYAGKNLEDATVFVEEIEDPIIWNKAVKRLISKWGISDPLQAAEYAFQQDPTKGVEEAIELLSKSIGKIAPKEGIDFALAQENNSLSQKLIQGTFDQWINKESDEAIQYVAEMEAGDQRDAAVRAFANKFKNSDPNYAMEWADTMTNPQARLQTMRQTYNNWRKRDSQAATDWINSTNLLPQEVANQWQE